MSFYYAKLCFRYMMDTNIKIIKTAKDSNFCFAHVTRLTYFSHMFNSSHLFSGEMLIKCKHQTD